MKVNPISVNPISGFPEWLPNLKLAEQRIINSIREQYELFGFTPIETAAVERMEVLKAKGGEDAHKQIFSLSNADDAGSSLGLHFDLTVPISRYVTQHCEELIFPFRRYQIQKVWRGEKAQKGRFREFYQCDIDIIGRNILDLIHDAEIPVIINLVFEKLGLNGYKIHISNRKVLAAFLLAIGVIEAESDNIIKIIDTLPNDGKETVVERILAKGLTDAQVTKVFDFLSCISIEQAKQSMVDVNADLVGIDELDQVVSNAIILGMPKEKLILDLTIARGLDYYTGTIYETFLDGKKDWGSICSGGRFDTLASYFSTHKFPGVGVSIGLTRLFKMMVDSGMVDVSETTPTRVLVTCQDRQKYLSSYLGLAKTLRTAGVPTEVYFNHDSLREQIGYASSKGIRFAIIAGDTEFDNDTVMLKDLLRKSQEQVTGDSMVCTIKRKLEA